MVSLQLSLLPHGQELSNSPSMLYDIPTCEPQTTHPQVSMATKSQTKFPAGNPNFRALRQRCAVACRNYNSQPEDASGEERAALWHEIIKTNRLSAEPRLVQSDTGLTCSPTDDPASSSRSPVATRSSPDPVSNRGKLPEAASGVIKARNSTSPPPPPPLLQSLPQSPTAVSSHLSSQPSSNTASSSSFPGAGLAPYIKPPLYVDYGCCLDIGNTTFINRNCTILDTPVRHVRIGERCLIGPNFSIYAVGHPLDFNERNGPTGAPSFATDVSIGDDCWIGGGVIILGGVTVGNGCVIGAGSVVTKDIPPFHLAYGIPARVIRKATSSAPNADTDVASTWNIPAKLNSVARHRTRIGNHEFFVTELTSAVLTLIVVALLIHIIF